MPSCKDVGTIPNSSAEILRGAGLQPKAGSAARHQEQEQLHQNHSQDLMGEVTPQGKGAGEKKKQELWTLST